MKARIAVALSVLAILVATLHVSGSTLPVGWSFSLTSGDAALAELIQNLLLFLPLGASLALAGVRPLRAIAIGAGLSFTVEFIQQWLPGRDPSAGDIVCNTVSTAIGVALVVTAPRWLTVPARRAAWQALAMALLAAAVWLGTGWLLSHPARVRALTLEHPGGLGYTIGDGWKLLFYPEHCPAWAMTLLNALWVGGWMLGVGYWGRLGGSGLVAVAVAVLGLLAVPGMTGLNATPGTEWVGAVLGIGVGWYLGLATASQ